MWTKWYNLSNKNLESQWDTSITGSDETSHAAGKKYRHLISKHFPKHQVQYRFKKVGNKKQAKMLEDECLRIYQKQFGELPPLNRAGVN